MLQIHSSHYAHFIAGFRDLASSTTNYFLLWYFIIFYRINLLYNYHILY